MKYWKFLGVLIATLVLQSLSQVEEPVEESTSDVIHLDVNNFHQALEHFDLIVVEFYAPWCGACKKFAPEYEIAATRMKNVVALAMLDATDETNIPVTSKFNVAGYPTVYIFQKGKEPVEYRGDYKADTLVDILEKKLRPAYVELDSVSAISEFASTERIAIVGIFDDKESAEFQLFSEAAAKLKEEFLFGLCVANKEVNDQFKVTPPTALIFKTFDEELVSLDGTKFAELENWIYSHKYPLVDEIGKLNSKLYIDSGIPIGFMFVETEAQRKQLTPILQDLAKDTRNKLNFVFIDWEKYGSQAKKLSLSETQVPAFAIEATKAKVHYALQEEVTEASLRNFVNKFMNGELKPSILSEPIPESNDGPVKIVVANTFKEIVLDSPENVFIEYYAPWCGHCKSLKPIWQQLGEHFKNSNDVTIAMMDNTANTPDPFDQVGMYPTLRLYKAGDKTQFVTYEGQRELEPLLAFVNENIATVAQKEKSSSDDDDDDDDDHKKTKQKKPKEEL